MRTAPEFGVVPGEPMESIVPIATVVFGQKDNLTAFLIQKQSFPKPCLCKKMAGRYTPGTFLLI